MLVPAIEGAATELGPVLARVGAVLLGGATAAGTASLSGDTAKNDSKATPAVRAVPKTGERCKKCPPEETGRAKQAIHHMTAAAREYQGRITGWPYSVKEGWSEEWEWKTIDFDGFIAARCMLQEAKGNYDQFLDMPWAASSFSGFDGMESTIVRHGRAVRNDPPTGLTWYFQGPKTRAKMLRLLTQWGIQSVVVP
nr:restriction endonuclease fold toxin 5 domain-containing protein [Paraburkholderia sp. ZP32-5]